MSILLCAALDLVLAVKKKSHASYELDSKHSAESRIDISQILIVGHLEM